MCSLMVAIEKNQVRAKWSGLASKSDHQSRQVDASSYLGRPVYIAILLSPTGKKWVRSDSQH